MKAPRTLAEMKLQLILLSSSTLVINHFAEKKKKLFWSHVQPAANNFLVLFKL